MKTRTLKTLGLSLAMFVAASFAGVAHASPAEQKRACIAASTQGQTERDAGNLIEAKKQLLMCSSDECPAVVRKSCVDWLADVEERLPSMVVRVLDASGSDVTDAQLTVDGEPAQLDGRPVTLNPGPHTVVVTDAAGRTVERKVLLAEKETGRLVSVQLLSEEEAEELAENGSVSTPLATMPSSPRRDKGFKMPVGAWVLYGVGVAGLGAFTYFGLSAKGELDDLKDTCSPNCTESQTDDGRRAALLADISLGVGAAALIGAGTWTILAWKKGKAPRDDRMVRLAPTRGGAYVGFGTRF